MIRARSLACLIVLLGLGSIPLSAGAARSDGGIDLAGMDKNIKPGDDFFSYTNGVWVRDTPIPVDRSAYGTSAILTDQIARRIADLIQGAAQATPGKSPAVGESAKIGDFYAAYMDEATIESKAATPLTTGLARIARIRNKSELATELGGELRADVDALNNTQLHTSNLFGLWVAADFDQPTRYVPYLLQGGLSLPDREYYLSDSTKMAQIRAKFQDHIAATLALGGIDDAQGKARRVFALQMAIAHQHWTRADSENVSKANNRWPQARFGEEAPGLEWARFFAAAHLRGEREIVVWQPSALIGEAALVASVPLEDWKAYLQFNYIDHGAETLSKAFVNEHFGFYGKVVDGTPQLRPRWKRAVEATNDALGEAVGKLYVARYFPPQSKAAVQQLVANLIAAFDRRIEALTWMSPQTKLKARAKLASLKVGVGYPDHWRSYAGLDIARDDAFGNAQRAELFDSRQKLAKLSRPVDRDEWVMNPQLVNAVNLPVLNALNFPAAMLQPPYFDLGSSAAVNYGSIGAVIGHEISHSFDSAGALFDASGKLNNWWTESDLAHFHDSAQTLVRQFDGYRPFPDLAVNGKQTLDENIADVAGLAVSLDAYHLSLQGSPAPVHDGFSGDQQFFIAFGQSWRTKMRDEFLRRRIVSDGHAPAQYRAETVRNLPDWYASFGVKPTDKLYLEPERRVKIW